MKQNYPNSNHYEPFLTKRNDSYIYINVQNEAFPRNPMRSRQPLRPHFQNYSAPKNSFTAFETVNPMFPKKHHSKGFRPVAAKNSKARRKFEDSMIRNLKGLDEFYRSVENMEVKIFGRKISDDTSWSNRNDFNDNQNFNLNLNPDFEKLNDSLQNVDYSIGAEDSSMIHWKRSSKISNFSGFDSPRSTFCFKKKKIGKSKFLNDFEIQNNFNESDNQLFKTDSPKFKKIKKSFGINFIPQLGNLSDDNEDDKKTVINKYKSSYEHPQESLIYPQVRKRHNNERLGSKRTVRSNKQEMRQSSFKLPVMSHSSYSDPRYCEIPNAQNFDPRFERKPQMNRYSGFKINPDLRNEEDNLYFCFQKNQKFDQSDKFSKKEKPKYKKKGHAAENIYKIMKNMSKIIYDRTLRRDKPRLRKDLEECLQNVDIKMNHLIGLKNLLSKFMKEETINTEDMDLSNLEILLFCLFLVKKRYLDLEALQWTPKCLNQFRDQEMLKRSEQNYKVVLKRAFKTLISTFNAENSVLGGNENEFYEHYFGKVSKEFNISIDSFKPQQIFNEIKTNKQSKKFEKRKSKKEFASMLKKSTEFMNLLQRYLEDDLVINGKNEGIFKDCMKELDRKLPLMIFNWQKRLGSEQDFKNEFIKFLVGTLVNDKVKLPWSASEVRRGVSSVLRLFRKA